MVLILNGYSRHNTGDWLLLEEAVRHARTHHPDAAVLAIAMDPDSFIGRTNADSVLGAPVRPGRVLRSMLAASVALISGGRAGSECLRAMRRSEHVYSVGGGFLQFRSFRELVTVGLTHGSQLLMARRLRMKVHMLPQSIGPFATSVHRWFARILLGAFAEVVVRDEASASVVEGLSPKLGARVRRAPDLVFSGARSTPASNDPRRVAVVVRNWWFPGSADPRNAEARYLAAVAKMIDRLRDDGFQVDLVMHSDGPTRRGDDRIATRRVTAQLDGPIDVISICESASPEEAADRYRSYQLVVAVRMHAALLGLRHGAAALVIAYESKSREIFGQLGLEDWVVDIESITAEQCLGIIDTPFPHADVSRAWLEQTRRLQELGLAP